MKTIKEIFEFMLECQNEESKKHFPAHSICNLLFNMRMSDKLSFDEYNLIYHYINDYSLKHYKHHIGQKLWWEHGEWTERINWIQEQIKLLS
jgi:hypothetical protein